MKTQSKKPTPIAVITGDVHFTVKTLNLATEVVLKAKEAAKRLNVPLILNGDTLDTKAIIRGECSNRLIELLNDSSVEIIVNTGNHDLLSEKSDEHVLHFLKPYATVVDFPTNFNDFWVVPYYSDNQALKNALEKIPSGRILIMHQGVETADLGHYVLDKSSLPKEYYDRFRVIGSHYHKRQDIQCGEHQKGLVSTFSYCGSPYTLSFGEAHDGPKGFNILYSDGSLELVPLDLPKHVVTERTTSTIYDTIEGLKAHDHLMLKVTGTEEELRLLNKQEIGLKHLGHSNFRLDLIPTTIVVQTKEVAVELTESELLDNIIEALDGTETYKADLKDLWRNLANENPKS